MKVLVAGAGGQLGYELSRHVGGLDILALGRHQLDVTDIVQVRQVCEANTVGLIINASAYTAVDKAEQEVEQAFLVNETGPQVLATVCLERGIPLLHVSTDYVFDGQGEVVFREDDRMSPDGVYARSKAAGEQRIRELLEQHIILRVSWVFGVSGANFVKTILRLAASRDSLSVVDDQWGAPTSAASIAEALLTIACRYRDTGSVAWGTYHYCGAPYTNWFTFAEAIVAQAQQTGLLVNAPVLTPIPSSAYPTPVKRPLNSRLDCGKIEREFGILPQAWKAGLQDVLTELLKTAV